MTLITKIRRYFRFLLIVVLLGIIFTVVFREQVGNFLLDQAKKGLEKNNYSSSERYVRAVLLINPNSSRASLYSIKIDIKKGEDISHNRIKIFLMADDEEIVIDALEISAEVHAVELIPEVEDLTSSKNPRIAEAAKSAFASLSGIDIPVRCKACGNRYIYTLGSDSKMPYTCEKCGLREVYPADRYYLRKFMCNRCGNIFIRENVPGESVKHACPSCQSRETASALICYSCGHKWGDDGAVFSCPKCGSGRVGGMTVEPWEAGNR